MGLPILELEEARTGLLNALKLAREGKRFEEVDMGGKMGKKSLLTYGELVQEMREVNYALRKADPELYGAITKRIVPNFRTTTIVARPATYGLFVKDTEAASGGLIASGLWLYHSNQGPILGGEHYINDAETGSLEKDSSGVWILYDAGGGTHDSQSVAADLPLTSNGAWGVLEITLL